MRLAGSFIIELTLSRGKVGVFALTEQITGGAREGKAEKERLQSSPPEFAYLTKFDATCRLLCALSPFFSKRHCRAVDQVHGKKNERKTQKGVLFAVCKAALLR